jgi:hypothetical protein
MEKWSPTQAAVWKFVLGSPLKCFASIGHWCAPLNPTLENPEPLAFDRAEGVGAGGMLLGAD